MAAERQSLIENPFVKGAVVFVGALIVFGLSLGFIRKLLALA